MYDAKASAQVGSNPAVANTANTGAAEWYAGHNAPINQAQQDLAPISKSPMPEFWCSIAYFEHDTQVSEMFKVPSGWRILEKAFNSTSWARATCGYVARVTTRYLCRATTSTTRPDAHQAMPCTKSIPWRIPKCLTCASVFGRCSNRRLLRMWPPPSLDTAETEVINRAESAESLRQFRFLMPPESTLTICADFASSVCHSLKVGVPTTTASRSRRRRAGSRSTYIGRFNCSTTFCTPSRWIKIGGRRRFKRRMRLRRPPSE